MLQIAPVSHDQRNAIKLPTPLRHTVYSMNIIYTYIYNIIIALYGKVTYHMVR